MSPPFDLIESYFDGGLSAEQEKALEEWLGADREHLRVFLREVHLSRGMRDLSPNFETEKEHRREDSSQNHGFQSHHWLSARVVLAMLAKHWRWAAFGAACGLLFVAWAWFTYAPFKLAVLSDAGVFLRRKGSERMVYGSVKLRSGDVVRTESSARALILCDREATRLEIGGDTSVEIHPSRRTKLLRLNIGTVYASVARQRFGSHLEFITPQARAKILGTDLKLRSLPDQTELEVYSGQVFLGRSRGPEGIPVQAGCSGLVADGRQISAKPIPPAAGSILWEDRPGIPGTTIADLTVDARFATGSDRRGSRESFETPRLLGDNYGARVRGYLHPPRTGDYTFWIAGDDAVELWLSPDDQPEAKRRICFAAEFTNSEQWEKHPSQRSKPIHLVGGRKYYIEALLKQSAGNDGLAVAWQGPGMTRQIIAGAYLSPVTEQGQSTPPE